MCKIYDELIHMLLFVSIYIIYIQVAYIRIHCFVCYSPICLLNEWYGTCQLLTSNTDCSTNDNMPHRIEISPVQDPTSSVLLIVSISQHDPSKKFSSC